MLNHGGEGLSYYLKLTWGQAIKESILWPPEITWQNTVGIFETGTTVTPHLVSEPDPSKIEKEGLVNEAGWKCTLCSVCRRTSDWLWIAFWCAFIGNANHMKIISRFALSCTHQVRKIENLCTCLVQQKALQTTQDSAINEIPNIPQSTLPFRSTYKTLLFECLVPRLLPVGAVSFIIPD